jgi:hypothetical protein
VPVEIEEAPSVVGPIFPDAKCRTFAVADRNATLFVLIVEMFGRNGRTARLAKHQYRDVDPSMTNWLRRNSSNVWSSAALLVASVIIFAATRGTGFQQFGIGLLTASVALIVLLSLFEAIWEVSAKWLGILDEDERSANPQESSDGGQ